MSDPCYTDAVEWKAGNAQGDQLGGRSSRRAWFGLTIAALSVAGPVAAQPSPFRSPFHPEQCERAISAGKHQLARNPGCSRARLQVAEGFLCKGLEDDPDALDAAISMFRQIVADEPLNFFAELELADALRKRFPLSQEAQSELLRTRRALGAADVGAARQELAGYVDENFAATADLRLRMVPLIEERAAALAAGTILPADMAVFVILQAETGIDGLAQAGRDLETYLALHDDETLATLYRAEILRMRGMKDRCRPLYVEAAERLCHDGAPPSSECSLARWRLEQLQRQEANGLQPDAVTATLDPEGRMRP